MTARASRAGLPAAHPAGGVTVAIGRRIPNQACSWCAHDPHDGPCPHPGTPCPCAKRKKP